MLVYYVFFVLFGLSLGSFANVLIARMPKGVSIFFPSSNCPKCHKKLRFYHNIPVISYIFLGGKCAFCSSKISLRYPFVELVSGALGALAFYLCGEGEQIVPAIFLTLCFVLLLALSVIDFEYLAVPESLLIFALFFALASKFESLNALIRLDSALSSALIFIGAIFLIKSCVSAWKNRQKGSEIVESMGEADVLVFGVIGALCGIWTGFWAIIFACLIQLVFHLILLGKKTEVPFIPALSLALLVALIFQNSWIF